MSWYLKFVGLENFLPNLNWTHHWRGWGEPHLTSHPGSYGFNSVDLLMDHFNLYVVPDLMLKNKSNCFYIYYVFYISRSKKDIEYRYYQSPFSSKQPSFKMCPSIVRSPHGLPQRRPAQDLRPRDSGLNWESELINHAGMHYSNDIPPWN